MHARLALVGLASLSLAASGCYLSHGRVERHGDGPSPVPTPDPIGPGSHALHVAVDGSLSCAIGEDARVRCWGQYMGFVYSRTHDAGASPTLVPDLDHVTALAISSDHACAVREDASVWCWGSATWGQLGLPREPPDESESFHETPVRVEGLPPARDVAVGWLHSCALLVDGGVACWGNDGLSEMPIDVPATGALDYTTDPIVAPGVDDTVQLDAHASSTCARRRDGTVRCWGENAFGEDGPLDGVRVHELGLAGAIDVITGGTISRALTDDGTVLAWGAPHDTTPGDGSVSVLGRFEGAVDLLTLGPRVCALHRDGNVRCLPAAPGAFAVNELDALVEALPPAREVAFGFRHACLIDLDGALACLGQNAAGELGIGTRGYHSASDARVALHDASRVARGADFACALTGEGLYCWGGNGSGALGVGAAIGRPSAIPVRVALDDVTDFAVRAWHACAVSAGEVHCWGQNDHGEVALDGSDAIAIPTRVALPAPARAVAVGNAHACAITDAGTYCWGDDSRGQLADDRFLDAMAPVRVALPGDAVAIAAGNQHTCVALASGEVACWGENHEGQIGTGFCDDRCLERLRAGDYEHAHVEEIPVVVAGVTGVTELRAIERATCGVGPDATFCWPASGGAVRVESDAFLGGGSPAVTCTISPSECAPLDEGVEVGAIPLPTIDGARDLVFDGWSGCAIDGIGDVRCWGGGERGQLGTGDGYAPTPQPVGW